MNNQQAFDRKYWNLAQASAWVEYREKQLVEDFFGTTDRNAYMALGMYPRMWPAGPKRHGRIEELRRSLEEGLLGSSGFRRDQPERLEDIPAAEWADYEIRPPVVCFVGQPKNLPWKSVRVLSADIKRMWRGVHEVSGRSKYDWDEIQNIYGELKTQNPEMSQNEIIIEVQCVYEGRTNKNPPSRTSIQNKIKTWS